MQYDDIEMVVPSSTSNDTTVDDMTDTACNEASTTTPTTRDTKYLFSSSSAASECVGGLDDDAACVPDTADGIHQPHDSTTSINTSTSERKLWQILMRIEGLNVRNIISYHPEHSFSL